MKPEDRFLYICVRRCLQSEHKALLIDLCRDNALDWELIYTLAGSHGVAPLLYHHLQGFDSLAAQVPQGQFVRFKVAYYQSAIQQSQRQQRIVEALQFFRAKSIDVMLIKGVAVDLLTGAPPWLSVSADVDIVLRRRVSELTRQEITEIGERFHGQGIEYDFYAHHDVLLNGAVDVDFGAIWKRAGIVQLGEGTAHVMCPEDMLLSLCINSCRKRYFRLKSLFDIVETIEAFPALDWQSFVTNAREYHSHNIVYAALLVAQMTVGCRLSTDTLDALTRGSRRAVVIRHTVRMLLNHLSLYHLSFDTGPTQFGRRIGFSLVLPYVTYDQRQAKAKMREAYGAWRDSRSS